MEEQNSAVNEIAKLREEREKWEVERKKAEEKKIKEEEEARFIQEQEKIKKKDKGKNIVIILLSAALVLLLLIWMVSGFMREMDAKLDAKDLEIAKQTKLIEEQIQLNDAYTKGVAEASMAITNQIVTSLNLQGFVEIDLPVGNNQTQMIKLGVIQ